MIKKTETLSSPQILEQKVKYKNISFKLNELKNIIRGTQKEEESKTNIFEYIMYPQLISTKELKNKILNIFEVKTNDKLFNYIIGEINNLFKNKALTNYDNQEEVDLRTSFYEILENLNYFISLSLIYYENKNKKKNIPLELLKEWIIKDNIINKSILSAYLNIFNLKSLLSDFYCINREEYKLYSKIHFLYLISILKLQNIYKYNDFITKIEQTNIFYYLYDTYNTSLREILDLTNNILSINTNFLPSSIIERILNDTEIANKIDNKIKYLLIEMLMINYSFQKNITINDISEFISYYSIIANNLDILSNNYYISWEGLNNIFNYFISNKEYDKGISLLNSIKNIIIINKYIDINLIYNLAINIPLNKIKLISNIIKNNKNLVNCLLKIKTPKDSMKLIKILKLNSNEYDSSYDEISINNFFQYKICSCIDNQFDILIDYGLINENTYNKLIYKLMKKTYQINPNKNKNFVNLPNDNYLPLNEDEEQNIKNDKQKSFFKKNAINYINKTNHILTQEDKDKILILYKLANAKNYKLSYQNQKLFDNIFDDIYFLNNIINFNINKYIPIDKFGPHDLSCLSIEKTKVVFIDNYQLFSLCYYANFRESKYIGVDSEWRHQFFANIKENVSILQLANFSENKIMIIDLLKLKNDKLFLDSFENYFSNKTFIGFSFDKNDIEQFNSTLKNFFQKVKIIDLIDIYQHKFLKKAHSLKDMCKEILGKELCKYEQTSNWENRPLKESQLHYAALDALACIQLYKKMANIE